MPFAFRRAVPEDAAPLAEFARRIFEETFAPDNRPEDMRLYVAETYGPDLQLAEILDPAVTTLLAEADGALAGFAQLRTGAAPACVAGPAPVEIWRFYVDRSWQGRGLAGRMMEAAAAAAGARGAGTLWLAVWERNHRALAFYRRSGFTVAGRQPFRLGTDLQSDLVMVRGMARGGAGGHRARRNSRQDESGTEHE